MIVGWTAAFDIHGFKNNFGINNKNDFAFPAMSYFPLISTICYVIDLLAGGTTIRGWFSLFAPSSSYTYCFNDILISWPSIVERSKRSAELVPEENVNSALYSVFSSSGENNNSIVAISPQNEKNFRISASVNLKLDTTSTTSIIGAD